MRSRDQFNADVDLLRQWRSKDSFDLCATAHDVVVVATAARSGSSWLVDLLKQVPDAVHLRGEDTTILRLHDLHYPVSGGSEALGRRHAEHLPSSFSQDLSLDSGWPSETIENFDEFVLETLWRLLMQWPDAGFNLVEVRETIERLLSEAVPGHGASFDAPAFSRALLDELASRYKVDPLFYDFGEEPDLSGLDALPWTSMLESPPYVLFTPWRRASQEDVASRPLVIKSAGNPYRLDFYEAAFPAARVRLVHMQRNPVASVNGLCDAWRSGKYQSFRVGGLEIDGYVRDDEPWRRDWWKLDLAPGWQDHRRDDLVNLCAWQWKQSHDTILDFVERTGALSYPVRYETLLAPATRQDALADLCAWLGISPPSGFAETRPINASLPPGAFRWRRTLESRLSEVCTPGVLATAQRLGYGSDPNQWP